jgi:hypothetical protein
LDCRAFGAFGWQWLQWMKTPQKPFIGIALFIDARLHVPENSPRQPFTIGRQPLTTCLTHELKLED